MIVFSSDIQAFPGLLLIWLIEVFVFLSSLRLMLSRCSSGWANEMAKGLSTLTDPAPLALGRILASRQGKPVPPWLPWLCVISGTVLVRYLLIWALACTT